MPTLTPIKGYHVLLAWEKHNTPEVVAIIPTYSSDKEYIEQQLGPELHRTSGYFSHGWLWENDEIEYVDETTPNDVPLVDTEDGIDLVDSKNVIDVEPVGDSGNCFILHVTHKSPCRICGKHTYTMHNPVDANGKSKLTCPDCCTQCNHWSKFAEKTYKEDKKEV